MHPHRPKLSSLIAAEIREGIAQRRWTEWLPQERALADELRASRSIVRQALALLKKEQIIESIRSKGNHILSRQRQSAPKRKRFQTIALLTPGSIEDGRPLVTLPIDDFRDQLMREGCQLQIIESKSCYKKNPETALAWLLAHYSPDCWILRLSTRAMQEWFQRRELPAIILGTCHEGVSLPSVDTDRRALSRHAVGVLVKAGHRNFSLLINREGRGGDMETERGFLLAVAAAQKQHPGLVGSISRHDESLEGVVAQVGRLLALDYRPTALFVAQPAYYLTVVCELASRGLKVPKDLSLITQMGGNYLSYMLPGPACYRVNSERFTRKLLAVVLATLRRETLSPRNSVILPIYVPGSSLRQVDGG